MCGIAGVFGDKPNLQELEQVLANIEHRGEKKHRYETFIGDGAAIGMHRLAIVDEKHGKQPFVSRDGQVALIFNGEIYNHNDLREKLDPSKVNFHSHCDTEVILESYLRWGLKFVNYLDGKFAIAIYDQQKKRLVLARDPMGVKPLYYSYDGSKTYFASEVKALTGNTDGDIHELLPGTLWVNGRRKKYFKLGDFNMSLSLDVKRDQALDLKKALENAVRKRIKQRDSKIACLLSGGVDSSIITYLATLSHSNVVAYTLSDPSKNSQDLIAAKKLCSFLNIEHVVVSPPIEEMQEFYLQHGVYMTETFEPVLTRNAVAYYFVCKRVAADGFKYCLNGEGADELFGGYDFIRQAPREHQDLLTRYSLSIIHNSYLKMADRASMYTTLEARVPYMDKKLRSNLNPAR